MPAHLCDRDDCPPNNASGPKAKCMKCGIIVFLFCHGFRKGDNDSVKLKMPDGSIMRVPVEKIEWICQPCRPPSNESSTANSTKPTANDASTATALNVLKDWIAEKHKEIVSRLDEIGPLVEENLFVTKGVDRKLDNNNQNEAGTMNARKLAKELFGKSNTDVQQTIQNRTPKRPLYSTVLQHTTPVTPNPTASNGSIKRKRNTEIIMVDNTSAEMVKKAKIPTPKQGTKDIQIGKPIETRSIELKAPNPLSKSVWVSGFHPETTQEELEDYIVNNTPLNEKTKFKCFRLTRKDQDITKMSFISFKIDVAQADYDNMISPDMWPQRIKVREFIRMAPPKVTFGQHLPSLNKSPTERSSKVPKTGDSDTKTSVVDGDNDIIELMETDMKSATKNE